MAEIKLNIGTKTGKTYTKVVSGKEAEALYGLKIGDKLDGSLIGLDGYEFLITGGSDNSGFPMRKGIPGIGKKKILASSGVGFAKKLGKGVRIKKTVAGEKIYSKTTQVNLKVLKEGKEPLEKQEGGENKQEKQEQ